MKLRMFCLCTLLAVALWPAAETARSGADKDRDADTRIKELGDKIKQQQKALAELESEFKRVAQQQAAGRAKNEELNRKKRFVKVEIRGKLIDSVQRNVKSPVGTYAVLFDGSQCNLDLGDNKELQSLARKLKDSEVIVAGKKLPRPTASAPPLMSPTMMNPTMFNPTMMQPGMMNPTMFNPPFMTPQPYPMMTPMMNPMMTPMMSPMMSPYPPPIALDVISVESLRPAQD